MTEKIILDCDPGHDDALAILLAAGSPEIELLAITTVAGNQTLPKVTHNARAIAAVGGITGVPIAAGATLPLCRPQIIAPEIHGESGLDGPTLPTVLPELDTRHAVDLIIEIVMREEPGTITLVPVGPLTNIALAMRKQPEIIERVKRVILMGGAYTRGNTTPAAEFNILADPEAAAAVFAADWAVTMVGLDLTHQATADPEYADRIRDLHTELGRFVTDILDFFGKAYTTAEHFGAPPVHDACCVAALIDPTIMETVDAFVTVELAGKWTAGMTVTDFRCRLGPANTQVATTIDKDRFWELIINALKKLDTNKEVAQ